MEKPLQSFHNERMNVPAHEEYQYLGLIRNILAEGEYRPDRHELTVNALLNLCISLNSS